MMKFTTERSLRNYVLEALNKCSSSMEFRNWLEANDSKLYVVDIEEPYSADELANLV